MNGLPPPPRIQDFPFNGPGAKAFRRAFARWEAARDRAIINAMFTAIALARADAAAAFLDAAGGDRAAAAAAIAGMIGRGIDAADARAIAEAMGRIDP